MNWHCGIRNQVCVRSDGLARAGWIIALVCAALPPGQGADTPRDPAPKDLTEATLEQLMNIEVTSVSKKEQELSKAPAAIYVITQEDIRRSGLTSIPELLRMAPGVEVARISAHQWAITARGFNGRFANKMLVLIDGRSAYTPMFSGVYWDAQDVPLQDIDRIEVIRGPGATMWGANAVNGVINIITKPAKQTQGGLIVAGGGTEEPGSGTVRYGGQLGSKAFYRAYSKATWFEPSLDAAGRPVDGDGRTVEGGFRLDWDASERNSWTFQGDGYRSQLGANSGYRVTSLTPPYSRQITQDVEPEGGDVLLRWKHRISTRSDTELQAYFDSYSRPGESLLDQRRTLDVDFRHRFEWSDAQELLWGVEIRTSSDATMGTFFSSVYPAATTHRIFTGFFQDEFHLVPDRLFFTVGTKLEHNDDTGFEFQPDARLMWTPTRRQAVWAAFSRAVRTPSRLDQDLLVHTSVFPGPQGMLDVVAVSGSPAFQSETLVAYQTGYRVQTGRRLSLDVTGYYNVYNRLETSEPGTPYVVAKPFPYLLIPYHYANMMYGRGRGVEASAVYKPYDSWRLSLGYTWLDLDLRLSKPSHDTSGRTNTADPAHQLQAHSYLDLPFHLQWDAGAYWVGAIASQGIPAYTRLDTRLGWRPTGWIEFSISGQNLLEARHPEFFGALEGASQMLEIPRSVFGEIVWRF